MIREDVMKPRIKRRNTTVKSLLAISSLLTCACTVDGVAVVGTVTNPNETASGTEATETTTTVDPPGGTTVEPETTDLTTTSTSSTAPGPTTDDPAPACGDGVLDPGEECDDGANNADYGPCTTACSTANCGDGFVFAGVEFCDAGEQNGVDGSGCSEDCAIVGYCGDGLRDPLLEECDLGPDNGGPICTGTCSLQGLIVFVTSSTFTGDLAAHDPKDLSGIAGATAICQAHATAANLHNPELFDAWISAGAPNAPASRFPDAIMSETPFVRPVDGTVVASSWSQLTSGSLQNPINRTELGDKLDNALVWTNTAPDGTASEPAAHCAGWTSANPQEFGGRGWADTVEYAWTELDTWFCNDERHLYCVEMPSPMG